MASLDYVYDLKEKFEKDNIDYLVIAIRDGKEKDKADVFYRLKDPPKARVLCSVLSQVQRDLEKKIKGNKKDRNGFRRRE